MDYYEEPPLYARIASAVWRVLSSSSVTERAIFLALAAVALVSGLILATEWSGQLLVTVPRPGGTLVEGTVGTPRFANPVLAASDADRDIDALVFSGLTRLGADGVEPDLATYVVSEEGRQYTFTIKPDAKFQDGTPVLADDVLFTIEKTQDPELRSPRRGAWAGVTVEKTGEREIVFRLKDDYPGFLNATTMGILPAARFKSLSAQDFLYAPENLDPIGAGPFRVASAIRSGGTTVGYNLVPWKSYPGRAPYLRSLALRFYADEDSLATAVRQGAVDSAYGLSPATAEALVKEGFRVERYPLPRLYAVFFNQNHDPVLASRDVRAALDLAVDKSRIVREVLSGYAAPLDGPIPPAVAPTVATLASEATSTGAGDPASARAMLVAAGFAPGEDGVLARKTKTGTERLAITVATADVPELVRAASIVAENWRAAGASADVKVYAVSDLAESVIRGRSYDALLFGEVIGRDADFYSFWHSSQRADPGLNVASYTSARVDDLLERARAQPNPGARGELLASFAAEVEKDVPAVFLYAPDAAYVVPAGLSASLPSLLATPAERFALVQSWYTETQRVWPFFSR